MSEAQFIALVKNGTIRGNTLVGSPTRTGNKWVAAGRIPALAKFFKPPPTKQSNVEKEKGAAGAPVVNPVSAPATATVAPASRSQLNTAKKIYKQFQPLNSTVVVWLLRAAMLVMAIHAILHWCLYHYGRSPSVSMAQVGIFILQLVLVIATTIFFSAVEVSSIQKPASCLHHAAKDFCGVGCRCLLYSYLESLSPCNGDA